MSLRIVGMKTRVMGHQVFISCATSSTFGENWAAVTVPPPDRHVVMVEGKSLHEILTRAVSGIFWDRYPENSQSIGGE